MKPSVLRELMTDELRPDNWLRPSRPEREREEHQEALRRLGHEDLDLSNFQNARVDRDSRQ